MTQKFKNSQREAGVGAAAGVEAEAVDGAGPNLEQKVVREPKAGAAVEAEVAQKAEREAKAASVVAVEAGVPARREVVTKVVRESPDHEAAAVKEATQKTRRRKVPVLDTVKHRQTAVKLKKR